MAPPSIPVPQYHTGAYYRDTEEELYYACSIASSNETADDLPGAGRTLGNFYSVAGRFVERRLGGVAEKLGHGPRAAVVRIHRQRLTIASKHVESEYRIAPPWMSEDWKDELDKLDKLDQILKDGPSRHLDMSDDHYRLLRKYSSRLPSSKEKHKLEKYCKRLIRYVRSNVESTKKQALDHIIEIAFQDEYVRELLLGMGAVNVIKSLQSNPSLWVNCGASLQRSSRRALLVLDDPQLHTFALIAKRYEEGEDKYSNELEVRLYALVDYLQHPRYSFVAARYLRQFAYIEDIIDDAVDGIAKAINANCDIVEFEECDGILDYWVGWNLWGGNRIDENSAVMEVIFRYAEKLPRTVSSYTFQKWLRNLETVNLKISYEWLNAHYLMAVLLKGIAAVNKSGDGDLRVTYSYEPLLQLLESPPDPALSIFAHEEYDNHERRRVPGAEKLRRLCDKLTTFANSENSQIRERAWHCAKVLLTADIYCRTAILKALSLAHVCYPRDFSSFVEETTLQSLFYSRNANPFLSPVRHCDAKGRLLHICLDCDTCTRRCEMVHKNEVYNMEYVLALHLGLGAAFSSAGHYPIFAGRMVNGERAYLATANFNHCYESMDCFITEGTKPEDLRIQTRKKGSDPFEERTPISVNVYVLSWPPDMYPKRMYCNLGLDATGPFSWKPYDYYPGRSRLPRTKAYISDLDTESESEISFAEVASSDEERDLSEEDDRSSEESGTDDDEEDNILLDKDDGFSGEESRMDVDDEDWMTAEEGSIFTLDPTDVKHQPAASTSTQPVRGAHEASQAVFVSAAPT